MLNHNNIKSIKNKVTFIFADGQTLIIDNRNIDIQNATNIISNVSLKEGAVKLGSQNLLGQFGSNTLNININSFDKSLIQDNDESPYYGYMNETCRIDLYSYCDELETSDSEYEVYMGRYYITSWESSASSKDTTTVTLVAVNLASKIGSLAVNELFMHRNISFKTFIINVIDYINNSLNVNLSYNASELDILDGILNTWKIDYRQLNSTSIATMFNDIINNTMCIIFIDRNETLRVKKVFNNSDTLQCVLSGSNQLFSYNKINGSFCNYSSVNIKYIENQYVTNEQLGSYNKYQPTKAGNKISISHNKNIVGINDIEVVNNNKELNNVVNIDITDLKYNNNNIILEFGVDKLQDIDITVYGQVLNNNYNSIKRNIHSGSANNVYELENKILSKTNINEYADNVKQFIELGNNIIQVEGYINPGLRLGDVVSILGTKLNIDGLYMIISSDYKLVTNYRNTIQLIRVNDAELNADVILNNNMTLFESSENGYIIDTNNIDNYSSDINDVVVDKYGTLFENLEDCLDGH